MINEKTILIVHNYYQIPGGEDTVVSNEKNMLEAHGHKVILYVRNNTEIKTMSKFQKILIPITTIFNPRTYNEIKRIIKKEKIDIVHVHNTLNLVSPAVYYAAVKMKKPVVQTIHNFRMLCPGATFYRNGHICEDCVIKGLVCSLKHKCYRNSFIQTLGCVISAKIHRFTGIYSKINYICLTEFNKSKLLQLKQIKPERVFVKPNFTKNNNDLLLNKQVKNQFLYLGRIEEIKGVKLLIEIWEEFGNSLPVLKVCGNGPLKNWCLQEIKNKNINNILVTDFLKHDEAMKELANSKALILPTNVYEGFPMTIVEAFSVGTPVICPDMGNSGNLVENGITGFKYKNENELVQILKSKNYDFSDRIYDIYKKRYTETINYKMISEIYSEVEK